MANKSVFAETVGRLLQSATARNLAGGKAYALTEEHMLAQLTMTGTLGAAFYQDTQPQVDQLVALAVAVAPLLLAKTALSVRAKGHMRDSPALLLVVLARRDPALFAAALDRVEDSGRMLRTFVQIMRSGQTGRKSLGSRPKAMVQAWLNAASDRAMLAATVGKDPSLADVIRMVHPKPQTSAWSRVHALPRPAFGAHSSARQWIAGNRLSSTM